MNKWLKLLLGAVLIVVPILIVLFVPLFSSWGKAALELIKGCIVIVLVLIGILLVVLGISDIVETAAMPKAKKKRK